MTGESEITNTPNRVTLPDVFMFLLEVAMWASFGLIGWSVGNGATRWLFAIGFAAAAMLLWGFFRPLGMSSAGSSWVFATPGPARLVLEVGLFLLAGYGLWMTGYRWVAETLWTFAALIYVLSLSRIRWLLNN